MSLETGASLDTGLLSCGGCSFRTLHTVHLITPNHPNLPQTTIYILKYIQYRSIYTYIVYVYTYKTDLSRFLETPGIFSESILMYFEHHIFLEKFSSNHSYLILIYLKNNYSEVSSPLDFHHRGIITLKWLKVCVETLSGVSNLADKGRVTLQTLAYATS